MSIYNENNSIVELEKLYLIDIDISTTDNVLTINDDGLITSTDVPFNTLATIAYVDEHINVTLQDAFDNSQIKEISVGSNPININSDSLDAPIITFGPKTTIFTSGITTDYFFSNFVTTNELHMFSQTSQITIGLNPSADIYSNLLLPGNTHSASSGYVLKLTNPGTGLTEWTDDGLAAITALINTKADISGESFNGTVEIYSNDLMHNIFSANTTTGDINVVGQFYLNYTQLTATASQLNNITNYLLKSGGTMTGNITFNGSQTWPVFNQNTTGNASTVTTNANLTGVITSVGNATSFGTFTSNQILTGCSDETGTGLLTFNTNPSFSGTVTVPTGLVTSARISDTIYITNAYNPSTFITTNDFTGNNQYVIMRALNALTAGGRIILGQGTYIIGSQIALPDYPYVISGTNGVIIQSGFNGTMFHITASDNITFTELTFIIPEFGVLQQLISYNSNNLVFDRCKITSYKTTNSALIAIGTSINFLMTDCVIDSTTSTSTSPILSIQGTSINITNLQMYGNPNNLQTLVQTINSNQAIVSNSSFRNGKITLNSANKATSFNSCIFVDSQISASYPTSFPFIELNDCNISGPTLNNSLIYLWPSASNLTYGITTNNCTWSGGTSVIRYIAGPGLVNIYLNSRCNKGDYVTLEISGPVLQGNLIVEQPLTILTRSQLPILNIPNQSVAYTSDYGYVNWDGSNWKSSSDNSNLEGVIQTVGNVCSFGSFTSDQILLGCSDETGSGLMVFNNNPTFQTSINTPIVNIKSGIYTAQLNTNTLISDTSFLLPNNQLDGLSGWYLSLLTPSTGETQWRSSNLSGVINSTNQTTTFGTFTSSQILTGCSDVTGSGLMVFNNSPTFTGTPLSTTASTGTNNTRIATTAFVTTANNLKANLESPTFTGTPLSTTATAGTSTKQIATTAFVTTANNLKADLESPTFTGTPLSTTATAGTNNKRIATTAFVTTANILKADLESPTFTGTPLSTTATAGTNTTQIATTAFVNSSIAAMPASSLQALYQVTAPQITTSATYPTLSIRPASNSYEDKVLTISDISNAETTSIDGNGKILLNSYTDNNIIWAGGSYSYSTGVVFYEGPTIPQGVYTPSAFASLLSINFSGNSVIWSYNRRFSYICSGQIKIYTIYIPLDTLGFSSWTSPLGSFTGTIVASQNITLQISPNYTYLRNADLGGTSYAVTQAASDNTTKIATTAFVKNQGYATLASPTFTGTPLSTTASTATNNTQIATTAFVKSNLSSYLPLAGGTISGDLTVTGNLLSSSSLKVSTVTPLTDATYGIGNIAFRFSYFHCLNIFTSAITLGTTLLTSIGNGLSVNSGALTGYVLNVSQTVVNTTSGPFYPGTAWIDVPGMNIFITPKTTTSRIMLDCSLVLCVSDTTTVSFRWVRYDSVTLLNQVIGIGTGGAYQASFRSQTANAAWANTTSHKYIDSPAKNTQLKYYLQYMTYDSSRAVYFNRSSPIGVGGDNVSCISTIILTELAS